MQEIEEIVRECKVTCHRNVSAKDLTSFKGGGELANLLLPDSVEKLIKVLCALQSIGEKPYLLGGGSNTIIADNSISRVVLSTALLNKIDINGDIIYAECGVKICNLTRFARAHGLGGFEFMAGVPASVGGILSANASAFGQQTADYVQYVDVLSADCVESERIARDKLNFIYRHGVDGISLGAGFKLKHMSEVESIKNERDFLTQRAFKQPKYPSCGSVFKNLLKDGFKPSAIYIEQCGLKGRRSGGAEISEKHANFIVNRGFATATDFLTLVELCERAVYEKFGVKLEREFKLLSNENET
ncbi:MAG: UDP-N-acetylmuramate dehydrogenase [Clostridia bacterium]